SREATFSSPVPTSSFEVVEGPQALHIRLVCAKSAPSGLPLLFKIELIPEFGAMWSVFVSRTYEMQIARLVDALSQHAAEMTCRDKLGRPPAGGSSIDRELSALGVRNKLTNPRIPRFCVDRSAIATRSDPTNHVKQWYEATACRGLQF